MRICRSTRPERIDCRLEVGANHGRNLVVAVQMSERLGHQVQRRRPGIFSLRPTGAARTVGAKIPKHASDFPPKNRRETYYNGLS